MADTKKTFGVVILVLEVEQMWALAAPRDVVALNFFFYILLFCGAIPLLANSLDKETAKLT
jgi:hypothetical protein